MGQEYSYDPGLQIARGMVRHHNAEVKFGKALSGVTTTPTVIWDLAASQPVYVPPTQARIHGIYSSSSVDSYAGGAGAHVVRIWGLTTWSHQDVNVYEEYEDVTLTGTATVATQNAWVAIHRMRVTTAGANGVNAGTITAQAATDATLTAQIGTSHGSTEMAVFAVPSGWQHYMAEITVAVLRGSGGAATIDFEIIDSDYATAATPVHNKRDTIGVQSNGASTFTRTYPYGLRFTGPCMIKVEGVASAASTSGTATWSGVTVPQAGPTSKATSRN